MPVDETWGLLLRLLTAMQPKTHRFGTDGTEVKAQICD